MKGIFKMTVKPLLPGEIKRIQDKMDDDNIDHVKKVNPLAKKLLASRNKVSKKKRTKKA